MKFDMDRYRELIELSNLEDMDSYYSKEEITEFFHKVFEDNLSLDEGLERLKVLIDEFIEELTTKGTISEEDTTQGKPTIYKMFPFYDLKDMITVKIMYLSINYFYRESVNTDYTVYENPDHIKITLTFK